MFQLIKESGLIHGLKVLLAARFSIRPALRPVGPPG
jgi:hypothetical protein